MKPIPVLGAGLAGSEAAWQLAHAGWNVELFEMRPEMKTSAHQTEHCAELVCSNSLGSTLPDRAGGVLQAELKTLDLYNNKISDQAVDQLRASPNLPKLKALQVDWRS